MCLSVPLFLLIANKSIYLRLNFVVIIFGLLQVQFFFTALKALSRKEIHYGAYATSEQVFFHIFLEFPFPLAFVFRLFMKRFTGQSIADIQCQGQISDSHLSLLTLLLVFTGFPYFPITHTCGQGMRDGSCIHFVSHQCLFESCLDLHSTNSFNLSESCNSGFMAAKVHIAVILILNFIFISCR